MKQATSETFAFLLELRGRLIRCILIFTLIFAILFYFANDLFDLLALPILKFLPANRHLIATHLLAPFFVPVNLTFILAVFIIMPYFFYQLMAFAMPALYQHEKTAAWLLFLITTFLFYTGICFAYFIVLPVLSHFIVSITPKQVEILPDMSEYLDFAIRLFFLFGTIFEIPIVIVLLVQTHIIERHTLVLMRPYVIVGAFFLAMFIAPPDVVSQTLLAIPMWLLFEIGLLLVRFISKREIKQIIS